MFTSINRIHVVSSFCLTALLIASNAYAISEPLQPGLELSCSKAAEITNIERISSCHEPALSDAFREFDQSNDFNGLTASTAKATSPQSERRVLYGDQIATGPSYDPNNLRFFSSTLLAEEVGPSYDPNNLRTTTSWRLAQDTGPSYDPNNFRCLPTIYVAEEVGPSYDPNNLRTALSLQIAADVGPSYDPNNLQARSSARLAEATGPSYDPNNLISA